VIASHDDSFSSHQLSLPLSTSLAGTELEFLGFAQSSVLIQHNMSDTPEPGGIALGLPSAAVLFLVWAFLFYLARIWSKLGKDDLWGTDGSLISLAMVTYEIIWTTPNMFG
jgi:hypothetical protein